MTPDAEQTAEPLEIQLNQMQAEVTAALNTEKNQVSINGNAANLQQLLEDVGAQLDLDTKELNECAALNNALKTMKDHLRQALKNNSSLITKINLLTIEKSKNIEKLTLLEKTCNELKKNKQETDNLKREKKELLFRQAVLDKEIVKAEIQIELITDVVLREKSF